MVRLGLFVSFQRPSKGLYHEEEKKERNSVSSVRFNIESLDVCMEIWAATERKAGRGN